MQTPPSSNRDASEARTPLLRPMGTDSLLRPASPSVPAPRPKPYYEPNEEPGTAAPIHTEPVSPQVTFAPKGNTAYGKSREETSPLPKHEEPLSERGSCTDEPTPGGQPEASRPEPALWKAYEAPRQQPNASAAVPVQQENEENARFGGNHRSRLVERERLPYGEQANKRGAAASTDVPQRAGQNVFPIGEGSSYDRPYSVPLTVAVPGLSEEEPSEQQPVFLQPILYAAVNYPTPYSVTPITDGVGQTAQPAVYCPGMPYPGEPLQMTEHRPPFGGEAVAEQEVPQPLQEQPEAAFSQEVSSEMTMGEEDTADERIEDAVPTAQMAQPVPVPLARLDFSAPSRRKWPWVLLIVALVLVLAFGALWHTGLWQKVQSLPEQWGIVPKAQDTPATMIPLNTVAVDTFGTSETPAPTQEQDDTAAVVTAFTADQLQGIAPATVVFTVEGSSAITQVRLMDDLGLPLKADIAQTGKNTWTCTVHFSTAYRGQVHVYISDADGFWMEGGVGCQVSIE